MAKLTDKQVEAEVSRILISYVIDSIKNDSTNISYYLAGNRQNLIPLLLRIIDNRINILKASQKLEQEQKDQLIKNLEQKIANIKDIDNKDEQEKIFKIFSLNRVSELKNLLAIIPEANTAEIEKSLKELASQLNKILDEFEQEEQLAKPKKLDPERIKNFAKLFGEIKKPGAAKIDKPSKIDNPNPSVLNIFESDKAEQNQPTGTMIIREENLPDKVDPAPSTSNSETIYISKNDPLPLVKSKIDKGIAKLKLQSALPDIINLNKFETPKALVKTLIALNKINTNFSEKINMDPQTAALAKSLLAGNKIDAVIKEIQTEAGSNEFIDSEAEIKNIIHKISNQAKTPEPGREPPPRLS